MKINQLKIGTRVRIPSPTSMIKGHRSDCAGIVIRRLWSERLVQVQASGIHEPMGASGWYTPGECRPA